MVVVRVPDLTTVEATQSDQVCAGSVEVLVIFTGEEEDSQSAQV